jgi:hypothetical protein
MPSSIERGSSNWNDGTTKTKVTITDVAKGRTRKAKSNVATQRSPTCSSLSNRHVPATNADNKQ